MTSRSAFLASQICGALAMLGLILNRHLSKKLISVLDPNLSDQSIDQFHALSIGVFISKLATQIGIPLFFTFIILYLVLRNSERKATRRSSIH